MIYVKAGHQNDMYFVYQKAMSGEDKIVRVFYSEDDAKKYVEENQRIGERNGNV